MRRRARADRDSGVTQPAAYLREQFGDIDVYLFDQLLRGRIALGRKVLDAGCGAGRNLVFLMRAGFDVWGVDESPDAIARVRQLAASIARVASGDLSPRPLVPVLPHQHQSVRGSTRTYRLWRCAPRGHHA